MNRTHKHDRHWPEPGDVVMDPYTRRHLGQHNAFLHREDREHVKQCVKAIHERQMSETGFRVEPGAVVSMKTRAAA